MPPKPNPQNFEAPLEPGDRALGWTIARIPFDPAKVWPERLRQRVKGEVNGNAFRTSLFPDPAHPGGFYLLVNRAMQAAAHIHPGDRAAFTLEPDLDPRTADLPEELDGLLDEAEGLRAFYDSLSEYARRELGKWIAAVKSDEARLRRAQQAAERLLNTMEAEAELPPQIDHALRARPKARHGWSLLTPTQRRNELMAVFHYQSPESRKKRIAKLCDLAETASTKGK